MIDNRTVEAFADLNWRSDHARVPYQVYIDAGIFEMEQEKLIRGPCWHLIGLECEIKEPGDYVATYIGNTPIVYSRGQDGKVYCFVNRCALNHPGFTGDTKL